MMRFRHDRPRRATTAFALALFLVGTHYCLVGDVASRFGGSVSCMACMAPAQAPSGSCHSAAGPARGAQTGSPAG